MAKQTAQQSVLELSSFQKEGFLQQQLSKGNKFTISNVKIGDYYQLFANSIINPSPRYQRPYTYNDTFGGEGSEWQQGLVAATSKGEFIQPIHLRFRTKTINVLEQNKSITYYVLEVLDGGHRTRTLCNFIAGKIKTPADFYLTIDDIKYDCSNLYFNELEEIVKNYFLSIELTLCIHYNLSNDQAGERFRTLNNLHNMSRQEKRSSFYKHIARIVRNMGAVDLSQFKMFTELNGESLKYISVSLEKDSRIVRNIGATDLSQFKMFSELEPNNSNSLKHLAISLEKDSRATDELVASLFYIFSKMPKGNMDSYMKPNHNVLDSMYKLDSSEDNDESTSIYNSNTEVYQRVNKVLEFINKLTTENIDNNVLNFSKGRFSKSAIIKLAIFLDWVFATSKSSKLKIENFDPETFWRKLNDTIPSIKKPHIEYQTYKIANGKVVIDKPGEAKAKVIPSAWNVWGTGDRLDDIQYINLHLMLNFDIVEWGFTKTKKHNLREFTETQKEQLYKEQKGICRRTGKPLTDIKWAADHIIPYAYGAPTIVENGQLISAEVNGNKSSGVTIDDVKLVCKRMGYKKIDSLIDMFETDTSELLPEDIELVVKKIFK
jgi:hypothetical protein